MTRFRPGFLSWLLAGAFLLCSARAYAAGSNFNDTTQKPLTANASGNVGVGTTTPWARLQVDGAVYVNAGATPSHTTEVNLATAGNAMFGRNVEIDGALYVDSGIYFTGALIGDGSRLSGIPVASSTANAVPKSTGSVLVDSGIYAVGSNVGIGTTAPGAPFEVSVPNNWYQDDGSKPASLLSYVGSPFGKQYAGAAWRWFLDNPQPTGAIVLKVNGNNGLTVYNNGSVGVGSLTPTNQFEVVSSGAWSTAGNRGISVSNYATSNYAANMLFDRARGTEASPTTVANGDYIGLFNFRVFTNAYNTPATFGAIVNGAVSDGVNPTDIFFSTGVSNEGVNPFTSSTVRFYIKSDGSVGLGGAMSTLGSFIGAKMVVDNNGNVGVGTTAPYAALSVMRISSGNTIASFGVAGSSSVIIDQNGNVGIGTLAPGKLLEVNGSAFIGPAMAAGSTITNPYTNGTGGLFVTRTIADGVSAPVFTVSSNNQGVGSGAGFELANKYAKAVVLMENTGSWASALKFQTSHNESSAAVYSDVMYLSSAGNVGIGTTSPQGVLDINVSPGISLFADYYGAGNSPRLRTAGGNGYLYFAPGSQYTIFDGVSTNNSTLQIQSYTNGGTSELRFFNFNGGSSSVNKITIANAGGGNPNLAILPDSGNVGIGTTAPLAKLEVDGAIYVTAGTGPSHSEVALATAGNAMFGRNVEIDGALYVDSGIYFTGLLVGDGSRLSGIPVASSTANAVPKSTGSVLVDSGIYAVGSNVGIGTTAPSASLEVNGGFNLRGGFGYGPDTIYIKQVSATLQFGGQYSHWYLYTSIRPSFDKESGIGESGYRLKNLYSATLTDDGANVGIGTILPAARLQVDGALYLNGGALPSHAEVSLATAGNALFGRNVEIDGALYVDSGIYFTGALIGDGSRLTGLASGTMITQNDTTVAILDGTATPIKFFIDGSTSMVVDQNGNVGVGTTAPVVKLDIGGAMRTVPIALSIAGAGPYTVATNAALGNYFTLVATQNFTLSNPTQGVDGQRVMWRIKQDGAGNRAITLDTNFRVGTDISGVTLSTTAAKVDYIGAVYDATDGKWDIIAFVKGY